MTRGAPHRLDQRSIAPQEAFLIRVEDGHERHFRQIEPFAQQVNPHQNVELAEPKPAHDLHAFDGVDVGVHVANADADLL